jgi:hypothetical protein
MRRLFGCCRLTLTLAEVMRSVAMRERNLGV